jgi:hypothetical protein
MVHGLSLVHRTPAKVSSHFFEFHTWLRDHQEYTRLKERRSPWAQGFGDRVWLRVKVTSALDPLWCAWYGLLLTAGPGLLPAPLDRPGLLTAEGFLCFRP